MFYKIAVIQNEKEIFKYQFADWKSHLSNNSTFAFYNVEYYDEHNICNMFKKLFEYDSIFYSMNSLNSDAIYNESIAHSNEIERFIEEGKGIFVGYSSSRKNRDFLPENYRCVQQTRNLEVEKEFDGSIQFADCFLFDMHYTLNEQSYESHAKGNKNIKGLYFDYLAEKGVFLKPVIIDKNSNKHLMLASDGQNSKRVIITSLPVDWQNHEGLMINIIKYCTEGEPVVEIVTKTRKISFGREYLFRQLSLNKIPFFYKEYTAEQLSSTFLKTPVTIFDETWDEKEIDKYCLDHNIQIQSNNNRILHYKTPKNDSVTNEMGLNKLVVHSAYQEIDTIEKGVLLYFLNKTPSAKQKYLYDSSLLATSSVIQFKREHGMKSEELCHGVIENIKRHIKGDGSYDSMFVASCNALHLIANCDVNYKENKIFVDMLNYLQENIRLVLEGKSGLTAGEIAMGLIFAEKYLTVSEEQTKVIVSLIEEELLKTNESLKDFTAQNCLRFLARHGRLVNKRNLAYIVKQSIIAFNDFTGDCKSVCVANFIISICNLIKDNFIEKNDRLIVYKAVFSAIGTLYKRLDYSSYNWNDDAYATVLCSRALIIFNKLALYPVDEILFLLKDYYVNKQSSNVESSIHIMDEVTEKYLATEKQLIYQSEENNRLKEENKELTKQVGALKQDVENIEEEKRKVLKKTKNSKIALFAFKLCAIIALFLISQLVYLSITDTEFFLQYLSTYKSFFTVILTASSIVSIVVSIMQLNSEIKKFNSKDEK